MLLTNKEIDLSKSFDKLKRDLKIGIEMSQEGDDPDRYALAFGYLSSSIKKHIVTCADGLTMKDLQKEVWPKKESTK